MRNYSKPITDRKIRFALVGCGRISKNHFAALREYAGRAELAAVCDVDPIALEKALKETGAPGCRTINKLIEKGDSDCVVLSSLSGLHPEQVSRCAEAA